MTAREKRDDKLRLALSAFTIQCVLNLRDDDVVAVIEGLIEAATQRRWIDQPDSCRLCGWTDGCKPDCAVEKLRELL